MAKRDIKFNLDGNEVLYNELARVISRAADTSKQINSRDKRRRDPDLKILTDLQQLFGRHTANSTLLLSRAELRLMQGFLIGLSSNLYTNIIPNYEHRIEKEPESKSKYQPYIDRCVERMIQYKELLDKIQALL